MSLNIRIDVAMPGLPGSRAVTNVFNAIELGDKRAPVSTFATHQAGAAAAAPPATLDPEPPPPPPDGSAAGPAAPSAAARPEREPPEVPARSQASPSRSPARQAALPPAADTPAPARRAGATDIPHAVGPNERGINMDIDPTLAGALRAMRRDAPAGTSFQVISGRRSRELQAQLYQRYLRGGNIAARPGHSRHEVGQAVDVRDPTGWYHRNAAHYGLGFPVRGDRPHMQVIDRARAARIGIGRPQQPAMPAPARPALPQIEE